MPWDIDKVYQTIREQKGKLTILFANAGVGEFAPLGEITEEHSSTSSSTSTSRAIIPSQFRAHCL